jgi:hypothetical protein
MRENRRIVTAHCEASTHVPVRFAHCKLRFVRSTGFELFGRRLDESWRASHAILLIAEQARVFLSELQPLDHNQIVRSCADHHTALGPSQLLPIPAAIRVGVDRPGDVSTFHLV